ncbi:MAG: NTP transferase domain-containing protein [Eubacteriales bacterium]|nr:NTP transferase domain-containing protein [Eubacteriales bacterium]
MRHLLITGQPGSGKSTLIRRLLETLTFNPSGYETRPFDINGTRRGFYFHSFQSVPDASNDLPLAVILGDGNRVGIPTTFELLGAPCLQQTLENPNDCIVLDEIGRFEQTATEFLMLIEKIFNQHTVPVFASLKKEPIPYIESLKKRSDCLVIDLDSTDRETAYFQALGEFKPMNRHLNIVLMAAGNSVRYGENKLLASIGGRPMYRNIFEHLLHYWQAHTDSCMVTVVSQYDVILEAALQAGCQTVFNPQPKLGISLTIQLGLTTGTSPNEQSGAVFFTADQPFIRYETIRDFLDRAILTPAGLLAAGSPSAPGNPVMFDQHYFAELQKLSGDQGGKMILHAHPDDTEWFFVAKNELIDIDVPKED